jgi:lipid-binding SYLF domain-containing protein
LKLGGKGYDKELARLHIELAKLKEWVIHKGLKVCILFEGRDSAGKGGSMQAITQRVASWLYNALGIPIMEVEQMQAIVMAAGQSVQVAVKGARRHAQRPAWSAYLRLLFSMVITAVLITLTPAPAAAQSNADLDRNARDKLSKLTARVPLAKALEKRAVAILVFPDITKAGFLIGGQTGNGVLFRRGQVAGHYNTSGISYGLQAGVQRYGYAMFFMNESAFQALSATEGFEVGVGPSVVVVDEGMGKSVTSTTLTNDVYAFVFAQTGLMAGVGLQGTKITRLNK